MDFNWSSFFLEIINFIVLVWLIKHFFYKPVCKVVDERRLAIDNQIANAKSLQAEAKNMKESYSHRLVEWEEEKNRQQAQLNTELQTQRDNQLGLLEKEIQEEESKNKIVQEKQLETILLKNEKQALEQGASFAAKLLQSLSSQDLESRLVEYCLKNISEFSEQQKEDVSSVFYEEKPTILITSAYPLPKKHKDSIQITMQSLFLHKIECDYKLNPDLIAGLRMNIGSYVLRANLEDELQFFSDSSNGF